MRQSVELLVSVRSVAEARSALEGGAGLIDIKEPSRGSLGRADDEVIRAIADFAAPHRPVSAALGEWADGPAPPPSAKLSYVKWGLAGCRRRPGWHAELAARMASRPLLVLTAYADWECAQAPPIEEILALACEHAPSVLLIDTHCKRAKGSANSRPTLLDWLPASWIADLVARCRDARVRIALAGSLGWGEIETLLPLRPDWIAVRGAVCADGERGAEVDIERVRRLAELVRAA